MIAWLKSLVFVVCTVTTLVFTALVLSLIAAWSPWAVAALVGVGVVALLRSTIFEGE